MRVEAYLKGNNLVVVTTIFVHLKFGLIREVALVHVALQEKDYCSV